MLGRLSFALTLALLSRSAFAADVKVGGENYFERATEELSKAFSRPGAKAIHQGGSKDDALKMLVDGKIQVARFSREPFDFEIKDTGGRLQSTIAAHDGFAIIVHPSKFEIFQKMILRQVKDIFFYGKMKDWSQLRPDLKAGPIVVYALDPASNSANQFHKLVMGKSHITQYSEAKIKETETQIVEAVNADENGIGYVHFSSVQGKAKVLAVGDDWNFVKTPTAELLKAGGYALSSKAHLFYLKDNADAAAFAEFAASPAGQAIVNKAGY